MKRLFIGICIALAITCLFNVTDISAQVHGKALYDLMEEEENILVSSGMEEVTWLPQGKGYLECELDEATGGYKFYSVEPKNGKRKDLFKKSEAGSIVAEFNRITGKNVRGVPFDSLEFVLDGKAILFEVEEEEYLFFLKENKMRHIKKPVIEKQEGSEDLMRRMETSQLWNGELSPDYKYIAYVKDFDIWVYNTETGEEFQVTFGGNSGIMNGQSDWVYPEEHDQRESYFWSPDSKKIAYLQFDVRREYIFPIVHELTPEVRLETQRYPTAGEDNPAVKLFVTDIENRKPVEVQVNSGYNVYIIKPHWLDDSSGVTFMRMNRRQNKLEFFNADPVTGAVTLLLEEEDRAFIEPHDDFTQVNDGTQFIWSSDRTGWRHIYMYDMEGNIVKQVTDGEWQTGTIEHVDRKNKWIYFYGYRENGFDRYLYRVKFDGSKLTQLTKERGWHSVDIDPSGKFFTDEYSNFDTPQTINIHRTDGKLLRNIYSTDASKADELGLPKPELVTVKDSDNGYDLYGLLFKPADFDPNKKYPLIVSVYGGPSKRCRNQYHNTGTRARLAQLGFIVWELDGRGTRYRGKEFLSSTYLKFGQVDVDDQAAGVKQIIERLYIDGNRVGMYGGSYGGYMTCMSLLTHPDVYHVGCAWAPVTDWRNYDSIYTERFMRTPQENPDGYKIGSALNYADNLVGKLLIAHGSIDNNVHPNNSVQMVDKLMEAGKLFDFMIYPNSRHGSRGYYGEHYGNLRVSYFLKHLQPENWEASFESIW